MVGVHHDSAERDGKHLDTGCCIVFEVNDGRITDSGRYVALHGGSSFDLVRIAHHAPTSTPAGPPLGSLDDALANRARAGRVPPVLSDGERALLKEPSA